MKPIAAKALVRAVERRGWRLLRISGSHHIYGKDGVAARLTIPVHGNKPLKAGLAKQLLKIAGLSEDDL